MRDSEGRGERKSERERVIESDRRREDGRGREKEDDSRNKYKKCGATRARLALCKKKGAVGTRRKRSRKRTGNIGRVLCNLYNKRPRRFQRRMNGSRAECETKEMTKSPLLIIMLIINNKYLRQQGTATSATLGSCNHVNFGALIPIRVEKKEIRCYYYITLRERSVNYQFARNPGRLQYRCDNSSFLSEYLSVFS